MNAPSAGRLARAVWRGELWCVASWQLSWLELNVAVSFFRCSVVCGREAHAGMTSCRQVQS